jgi:alpha-glucosidase
MNVLNMIDQDAVREEQEEGVEGEADGRRPWWRSAAIYQVYPRSFADGDGDGVGDLAGLLDRLPYLADLGVQALWINPWYPSPMADAGYDVADYRDIDPAYGTLADAEALIDRAHRLGLRIIVDIVPNHCSIAHPWFVAALAAGPGSAARRRFWFRPGRGADGELPPNGWHSIFGGPAWTRVTEPDGRLGEWYLHLFAPEQPDFNWDDDGVRAEFLDVLRFWLDRGVDGLRIDSAGLLVKDPALPELPELPDPAGEAPATQGGSNPYTDLDGVHEIYREWRALVDRYPGDRALIGEVWLPDAERFARYLRPDELHTAFNFDFLGCPWRAADLHRVIDETLAAHAPVGAPPTWVLSNHDVVRHVTRYGRADTGFTLDHRQHGVPTDLDLGRRRARAAVLLALALPGAVYVYQGEELGLEEVEDLPDAVRQDPMFRRSGGTVVGRDGCRIPMPWSGDRPPYGFSPPAVAEPWLPMPGHWAALTVEAQQGRSDSMHTLYRDALRLRRCEPALGDGGLRWLPADGGVLAFDRGNGFQCLVNLSARAVPLPDGARLLLSSLPPDAEGCLPPDAAAWLRTG